MWGDESEAVAPIIWLHQIVDAQKEEVFFPELLITFRSYVTGPCEKNSPVTGEFPAQMASNADIFFPVDDVIMWPSAAIYCDMDLGKHKVSLLTDGSNPLLEPVLTCQSRKWGSVAFT